MQTRIATFYLAILAALVAIGVPPQQAVGQVRFQNEPRDLAPGVLKTIPAILDVRDSFSLPMALPGIKAQAYQPKTLPRQVTLHELSRRVVLFRDIWQYEFSFTGLRQMTTPVRLPSGEVRRENLWYMVYRVRNLGKTMNFEQVQANPNFDKRLYELQKDKQAAEGKEANNFLPRFSLEGWVIPAGKSEYEKIIYRNTIDPSLVKMVQAHEDGGRRLLDTVAMSKATIPVAKDPASDGVWGAAVWRNVDPRIDYVSVFASGLTNAYRIQQDADGEISLSQKTLQLNFWRPGDTVSEVEDKIQYGIPLFDDPRRQILVTKRYALPGPVIRVYHKSDVANRDVLIAELGAQVSLEDFSSPLTPQLDGGKMPPALVNAIEASGLAAGDDLSPKSLIPGQKWLLSIDNQQYEIALEPQYWEPDFGKIRFIKSLDHLWIYR